MTFSVQVSRLEGGNARWGFYETICSSHCTRIWIWRPWPRVRNSTGSFVGSSRRLHEPYDRQGHQMQENLEQSCRGRDIKLRAIGKAGDADHQGKVPAIQKV